MSPDPSEVLTQSALLTAHLIGLRGVPILGRSVIYRTAVPVPLLAESIADPSAATCGRARPALDAVWRYFIAHGCLRNGTLTQGYFDSDPRLVERYMGPGSSHWGLRSLVLAYMHAPGSEFWTSADEPLKADSRIGIHIPQNRPATIRPNAYSIARQVGETLLMRDSLSERRLLARMIVSIAIARKTKVNMVSCKWGC
jgi:hypothetical protein